MNDDFKKILDESYNNNNDSDKSFVDPNDLLNVNLSNNSTDNVDSTNPNNNSNINPNINTANNNINIGIPNQTNVTNSSIDNKEKPKENKKKIISLPVLIFIIIVIILIIFLLLSDFKDTKKNKVPDVSPNTNSVDKDTDNKNEINEQTDDIYGYSILTYIPDDDSWMEYYKIVELHVNEADKILISYNANVKNATNQVRSVNAYSAKIVNNKLYYQLFYNSSSNGISTYNNIMCIDLSAEDKTPYEVLNWKQDENNYKKTINEYKVTYDYIYFNTYDSTLFYKYNLNSKEVEESNEEEFNKIKEKTDSKYTRLSNPKIYYREKEVYIKDNNKLMYGGEAIYTANNSVLNLYYSFSGRLVFSEGTDCIDISCDTIKYYRYDFVNDSKEEIDFNSNQIFSQVIWHR